MYTITLRISHKNGVVYSINKDVKTLSKDIIEEANIALNNILEKQPKPNEYAYPGMNKFGG